MYKEKFDLTGKIAIITGSSKGIGEHMAHALAQHGASVVVSSRNQEAVDGVAEKIKSDGGLAAACACNVGELSDLKKLVDFTTETYGGVDILINNAAINPTFGPLKNAEPEVFDKMMDVNVKGALFLSNLCIESMKSRGGGSIINVASVEGMRPSFGLSVYSITKSALIMLTMTQAKEWGRYNIRSNALCPGLIKTKLSRALWDNEDMLKHYTSNIPSGRMALPDEMAGFAVFLSSDASSYCTGGTYTSDGGYMIAG